ncbi:dihydroorotase [Porphyromonas gingivicanis]|uniref:dihydroorotase n=1 Tax=Porphyromonas gingivicanis TaxID=266762 RepID=UPI0004723107|nr:dihydroorotase [Porphyromonas gingivicanis]
MKYLLLNAEIINEGETFLGSLLIQGQYIEHIFRGRLELATLPNEAQGATIVPCEGLWLLPGCIDDQVHFRDPGLTHKADIESESRAAIAGGVTSFMDMPNTIPTTTDYDRLMQKHERAAAVSWANYSFFIGGTNDNAHEIFKIDASLIPGIKLFLGASTGNMLVDNQDTLRLFFSESPHLIAIHSESEEIIRKNKAHYTALWGEDPPIHLHPQIRSEEACYRCTSEALDRAEKYNTRLHVLHLSTAREAALFRNDIPLREKQITAEVCVHHLWFTDRYYASLGTAIKWNPAVKTEQDRDFLRQALIDNRLDIVATDHAPHLKTEKEGGALKAASGGPLVQHSLLMMLELARKGVWSKEFVVEKMAHAPAELFHVRKRGYLRTGYYADIVLVNPRENIEVSEANVLSRCGWSPLSGVRLSHTVHATFVNGQLVYSEGKFLERGAVLPLLFDR